MLTQDPFKPYASKAAGQRGLALVMVLLFLVAITGLTVWAARQAMLGEGMSRNQQDLEVARQAAESALRDAERDLKNVSPMVDSTHTNSCTRGGVILPAKFDTSCTGGLCYRVDADYGSSQWDSAAAGSIVNSEPWWPVGKGGLWKDVNDPSSSTNTKPVRVPPATDSSKCNFTGGVPLGTFTGAPSIRGVAAQPEYLIEYFRRSVPGRKELPVYRITSRGFGYNLRTQVVLQSIYLTE